MKKFLFFISFIGLLVSTAVRAAETAPRSASGVIIFHGAIVEGPCTMDFQTNDVRSHCYRSGMKEARVNTKTITKRTTSVSDLIPASMGEAKLNWLDEQKSLAMVVVSYL